MLLFFLQMPMTRNSFGQLEAIGNYIHKQSGNDKQEQQRKHRNRKRFIAFEIYTITCNLTNVTLNYVTLFLKVQTFQMLFLLVRTVSDVPVIAHTY